MKKITKVLLVLLSFSLLFVNNSFANIKAEDFHTTNYATEIPKSVTLNLKVLDSVLNNDLLKEKSIETFNLKISTNSKQNDTGNYDMEMEVKFVKQFSLSKEKVKSSAAELFCNEINIISKIAYNSGYDIQPDLDDIDFQSYVKTLYYVDEHNIIDFIKFMDIYENYQYNEDIQNLINQISTRVFTYNDILNEMKRSLGIQLV